MNKFDWSRITYDYSHLPWSPTAPGRSAQQQQQPNYSTWSKTYYPAPGQSYRRDVIYWPSGVTPHHNKSTKSYADSSCAGGDQHRPSWNASTSSGAVVHDISSKAVSHKRQFPELRSKSELFNSSSPTSSQPQDRESSSTSSSPKPPSGRTPLESPTTNPQQSPSILSSSRVSTSSDESESTPYNKRRPYRNNSSAVAACLSYPNNSSQQQHQGGNNSSKSPWSW